MKYSIPLEGSWYSFDDAALEKLRVDGSDGAADFLLERVELQKSNPLSCFLPHGVARRESEVAVGETGFVIPASKYSEGYKNDGVAFLNDYTSDICAVLAPNQCGKTFSLAAWTGLRILPCQPHWPVFSENGIKCPEWEGPKRWVVASYSWGNVDTLFQRIKYVFPREELGQYAPGGRKTLTFDGGRTRRLSLMCGSEILFLCYGQAQHAWESFDSDGASLDEQCPKEKYIGWVRSTTTRGDYTPCGMALTGHVLDGRPDTGSAGWIKTDLYDGDNPSGSVVSFYHYSIDTTPNEIIGPKKKKELWGRWVDPDVVRSKKEQREAVARYYGGWEEGSGMVFGGDVYQRDIHVIPPIWEDDKIPRRLTKMRAIDYGSARGINVCLWAATDENNDTYIYRALYETGLEIAEFVAMIIDLSHNDRILLGEERDGKTGNIYQRFEERPKSESFYGTVLDPRSAAQSQQGETLEDIFRRYGLLGVFPGRGQKDDIQIPRLKDLMRIDYSRNHVVTGEPGAPALYFFDTISWNVIREIEKARLPDDGRKGYINAKDAQHAIDALKYLASESPRYLGDFDTDDASPATTATGTKFTGY